MRPKENIKELFFNHPTKRWHFDALVKQAGLSRTRTNEWLKKLTREKLIKKIKPKGKMPYYVANYSNIKFKTEKKLYAFQQFEKTGFLAHLSSLRKVKTVIIFGSFARSDWYHESDIDLFIYGDADDFEKGYYEKKLQREIQVFHYKNKKSLKRLEPAVIPKIMAGLHVKGDIEPFRVSVSA